jgi:hypothetical protein
MRRNILVSIFPGFSKPCLLFTLTLGIFFTSLVVPFHPSEAQAAQRSQGYACSWYRVHAGDTLGRLARRYHSTIGALARTNRIRNVNLIFIGQSLCIPYVNRNAPSWQPRGVFRNGVVRWYAYDALEWTSMAQITGQIRQVATLYGLPASLLLAIAWQESGWKQHVISRDGGIGVMQVMPTTASWINRVTGRYRDPYKLWDNLTISATYLSWLWRQFGGNWAQIISAYNEGGYAVAHWGIYNWPYVNNVLFLSRRLW